MLNLCQITKGGTSMKIDIWSDFACPYCFAGLKKFQSVLNELDNLNDIEVNYRSIQLHPNLKHGDYFDIIHLLADSYEVSKEKALRMMEHSITFVHDEGLSYNYEKMIPANTLDAHRLTNYAKQFNKDTLLSNRIFKAHFEEGFDIGNRETLCNLAEEVGLNKENVLTMLNSDIYHDEIKKDEAEAIKLNIEVVPTLIINDEIRIAGVLSLDDFAPLKFK